MLQMEARHLLILQRILAKYPYRFYAYGSRVKNVAKKYSDLDLCYQENIPLNTIAHLEEELEESDLPFVVELINWQQTSLSFQELIRRDLTLVSK